MYPNLSRITGRCEQLHVWPKTIKMNSHESKYLPFFTISSERATALFIATASVKALTALPSWCPWSIRPAGNKRKKTEIVTVKRVGWGERGGGHEFVNEAYLYNTSVLKFCRYVVSSVRDVSTFCFSINLIFSFVNSSTFASSQPANHNPRTRKTVGGIPYSLNLNDLQQLAP